MKKSNNRPFEEAKAEIIALNTDDIITTSKEFEGEFVDFTKSE